MHKLGSKGPKSGIFAKIRPGTDKLRLSLYFVHKHFSPSWRAGRPEWVCRRTRLEGENVSRRDKSAIRNSATDDFDKLETPTSRAQSVVLISTRRMIRVDS